MAYLKELREECANPYCLKQAQVALYTHRNEHWLDYCRRHGAEELRRLKKQEEQA